MAWYNCLVNVLETETVNSLEVLVDRVRQRVSNSNNKLLKITNSAIPKLRGVNQNDDRSRAFDDYKIGERSPSDGVHQGKLGRVMAAEVLVPESGEVFRHLLWKVLKTQNMRYEDVLAELKALKPVTRAQYLDMRLSESGLAAMLANSLSSPLHVAENDFRAAMDHLAVQLMFLRLDVVRHMPRQRKEIALNIAVTLKPLAMSPWLGPFHEKMFDWLEENVWGDLFDQHFREGDIYTKGWRKFIRN